MSSEGHIDEAQLLEGHMDQAEVVKTMDQAQVEDLDSVPKNYAGWLFTQ